jgi:hypothetical protein
MGVYYMLNSIFPSAKVGEYGKRNTQIFMLGSVIYIIIYALLRHLELSSNYSKSYDIFHSCFILLVCADVASVSYLYKSFFGRTIFNELTVNEKKWHYDIQSHTYKENPKELVKSIEKIEKKIYDTQVKEIEEKFTQKEYEIIREKERIQNTKKIIENKKKIRAVNTIQKWWRNKLYEPSGKGGIFYNKAKENFNIAKSL